MEGKEVGGYHKTVFQAVGEGSDGVEVFVGLLQQPGNRT